jgi:hypothetical protein
MDATADGGTWAEPALNGAAELVMRDVYREAVQSGEQMLTKVPTWREMDTVMRGRRAIPGLEAHHVVPKEVMELLGIPEVQWRDVPGLLVDQWKHRRNNTPGDLSFHHILAEELRGVDVSGGGNLEAARRIHAIRNG